MVHRRGVALLIVSALSGAVACRKPEPPTETESVPTPPIDHLAVGEIPEGRDKAWALPLPVQSAILNRFSDEIDVESMLTPEELSNFVRTRVQTQKVTAGAQTTTFDQAVVPAEPKRILHIDVSPAHQTARHARSTMTIRDVTPPPPAPKISDEDAWKKAGRTPDGRLLDPDHMK